MVDEIKWMRVLPLIVGIAFVGVLVAVLIALRNPAPVQYCADWPYEYVQAPEEAFAKEFDPEAANEVLPGVWFIPSKEVGDPDHPNRSRSWVLWYDYDGEFGDVAAARDDALRGRGLVAMLACDTW
jgi:hypothetical protein